MRLPSAQMKQLRSYGGGAINSKYRARTATAGGSKRYSGTGKSKEELAAEAQEQDGAYGQGAGDEDRGQDLAGGSKRAGKGPTFADS